MLSILPLAAGVFALFLSARTSWGGSYSLFYALLGSLLVVSAFPGILQDAVPR